MSLPPGTGHIEIAAFANPLRAGVELDAQARLREFIALFATGQAAVDARSRQLDWSVMGGARWSF